MKITEAREAVKKYDLQGQVDREFANEKESGRYDIISECKNSQRFLENIKNELKNKEEKIKKEECSKWDKIHEDKKPLHKECFFVQMELKEEYCSECKRYDEIQKLQNDMKKIQEARNCFKECADRDYNMM